MSAKSGSPIQPTLLDNVAMALWRPWVLLLAAGFLLTPSHLLVAGINSGAAFLKIGTGARPAALGSAYTAVADDVDALYYNPGGLARLKRRDLGATHAQWLLDTKFDFVGYAHPTSLGTFGLGVTRLTAGRFEGRGADRQAVGGFTASDTAYTVGYSRVLSAPVFGNGSTSLGGNLKLLQSTLGAYSASAVAFDLGAQHRFAHRPISLGVSVLNMGQGMRFLDQTDPLPLTLAAGAAYRFGGALQLALDVRREVYDARTEVGIGTEYAFLPSLSLRAGYASGSAISSNGGGGPAAVLGGMGAGIGIHMRDYRADYTFAPFGELGNVQRISLGARFGNSRSGGE